MSRVATLPASAWESVMADDCTLSLEIAVGLNRPVDATASPAVPFGISWFATRTDSVWLPLLTFDLYWLRNTSSTIAASAAATTAAVVAPRRVLRYRPTPSESGRFWTEDSI